MTGALRVWTVISCLLLTGAGPSGRNLLKNGNFEKFTGSEPDAWSTTNIPKLLTVVSPSGKSRSGNFAVKCEVKDFHGSKMAGMIRQKEIDVSGETLRLSGYFLLNSVGKDVGYIALDFQNDEGSTIGMTEHQLTAVKTDFVPFSFDAKVPASSVHLEVKCTLLATTESGNLHEGSSLLLDDLELVGLAAEQKIVP